MLFDRPIHSTGLCSKVTGSECAKLFKNKIALFFYHKTSGIIQPVFKIAAPAGKQTVVATLASTTTLPAMPPYPASAAYKTSLP